MAAAAGASVAEHGGNAVDAAIAAVIVSMCTDLGITAPGASGFISVWPAGSAPVVVDGYAEMPGRGLPPDRFGSGGTEIEMDYGGGMRTIVGYGSIATPGAFAGLGEASNRYGELPWKDLVAPAIELADRGFPLSSASSQYLVYAHDRIFGWHPESRRALHHSDGRPLVEGDIVHIAGLTESLELIAERGPDVLYRGELGRRIAAEIQDNGGLLTADDLAAYVPIVREPVTIEVDDWTVASNPPPAVGGVALVAMLLLLDDHPFTSWSEDEVDRLIRVQRAVLRYRRSRLDVEGDRAAEAAALLDMARAGDLAAIISAPSTVHTSAVDTNGNAAAITVSAGYGSGAMVAGTGMWLNNSLGEIELHPAGFHELPPGTRLVSNMAPTVAKNREGAVLAIGSPGADRITTAISSVLLNFIHLGMSLTDAIAHPRIHTEFFDGVPRIAHEPGVPVRPIDDLVPRRFPDLSMYFGGVQAALWDPFAGLFEAADPRRAGGVARGGVASAGPDPM